MTHDEIRKIEVRQQECARVFQHSLDPSALSDVGRMGLIDIPRLIAEVRNLQAERYQSGNKCDDGNKDGNPRPKRVWILHPAMEFTLSKEVHGLPAGSNLVVPCDPNAEFFK
ncbi:MAG: hypothetical protein WCK89_08600 [bacterium]